VSETSDKGRYAIKQTRVYDKTRPEGKQEVAYLFAHGDAIYFGCQMAGDAEGNRVAFLGKQHAVEFASCLLMMALGLPGAIPDGDVSFGPEMFGPQDAEDDGEES
jgi:hypothetical protein